MKRIAYLILVFLTSTTSAISFAISSDELDHRGTRYRQDEFDPSQTEQVDVTTGGLGIKHLEVSLPGPGGNDINVWRSYSSSSLSAGLTATSLRSHRWAALGPGWTLAGAPRIYQQNSYYSNEYGIYYGAWSLGRLCSGITMVHFASHLLTIETADGSNEILYSTSPYEARTKSNWRVRCVNNSVEGWSPQGTRYEFGNFETDRHIGLFSVGMLPDYTFPTLSETYMTAQRSIDTLGNILKYSYLDIGKKITLWRMPGYSFGPWGQSEHYDSPAKVIKRIEASDGRWIEFDYHPTGRLKKMTDHTGRGWTYEYQTPGKGHPQSLTKVTLPEDLTWLYEYGPGDFQETSGDSTIHPLNEASVTSGRIIKITYPTGGSVSYAYEPYNLSVSFRSPSGSVPMYARGERVVRRMPSSGGTWSYTYVRGASGVADKTIINAPNGATTFEHIGPSFAISTQAGYPPTQYQNNAWLIGKIIAKRHPDGSHELFRWTKREISNTYTRIAELGFVHDEKVWTADLSEHIHSRDGNTYWTTYDNHDQFGNPGRIVEFGPNGSRIHARTYLNNIEEWIIGMPLEYTVTEAASR